MALAQGLLTSVAVAIVGVGSPLLLGIAAAVCSLIPFVGPALVWLPVAIFLFINGHWWKGLFLLAWGAFAVGTADNIIRPLVIADASETSSTAAFVCPHWWSPTVWICRSLYRSSGDVRDNRFDRHVARRD